MERILAFIPLLIIVIILFSIKRFIDKKRRQFRMGRRDLETALLLFKKLSEEGIEEKRPRSLNNMARIYAPLIAQDFPDLNVDALLRQGEDLVLASCRALQSKDLSPVMELAGPLYVASLESKILQNPQLATKARQFKIHDRALSYYVYEKGKAQLEFQYALESRPASDPSEEEIHQWKARLIYLYVEDPVQFDQLAQEEEILTVNCPNCGAPISHFNQSHCEFCGTGFKNLEIKAWLASELILQ